MNKESTIKPNAKCKLCYGVGSVKRFVNPNDKIGKMDLCDCIKIKLKENR